MSYFRVFATDNDASYSITSQLTDSYFPVSVSRNLILLQIQYSSLMLDPSEE